MYLHFHFCLLLQDWQSGHQGENADGWKKNKKTGHCTDPGHPGSCAG